MIVNMYADQKTYTEFFHLKGETVAASFCPISAYDSVYRQHQMGIMLPIPQRVYVKCQIIDEASNVRYGVAWVTEEDRFTVSPHLLYFIKKILPVIDDVMDGKGLEISFLAEIDAGHGAGTVSNAIACIAHFLYTHHVIDDYGDFFALCKKAVGKYVAISSLLSVMRRTNNHANFVVRSDLNTAKAFSDTEILNPDKSIFTNIEFYTDRDFNFNFYDMFDVAIINSGGQTCPVDGIDMAKREIARQERHQNEIRNQLEGKVGPIVQNIVEEDKSHDSIIRKGIIAEFFAALTKEYKSVDEIFNSMKKLSRIFNIEDIVNDEYDQVQERLGHDALVFHNAGKKKMVIIARRNTLRKKIEELNVGKPFFYSWERYQDPLNLGIIEEDRAYRYCVLSDEGVKFAEHENEISDAELVIHVTSHKAYMQEEQVRSDRLPSVRFTSEVLQEFVKSDVIESRYLPKSSYSISRSAFISKIASPLKKLVGIELATQGSEGDFKITIKYNDKKVALIK